MSNQQKQNFFAIFGLLFGACFWGVVWYPYRLLEQAGISGVASSFYTYTLTLAIAAIFYARHWRSIGNLPKNLVWLSVVAGWTNLAYVLAVLDGHVMRVILLFYLSPLWTLILAHIWLKERTNKKGLLIIVVAMIGASIMLYDPSGQYGILPIPRTVSDWLALSAGICFAITNVLARKSTHLSIPEKSFAVWVGAVVMSLLCFVVIKEPIPSPNIFTLNQWLIMLMIAMVLLFGTVLVQYGVKHIAANRASVIFLFELVVAAIASYYLAHEAMTWNEWLGGGLIVLAGLSSAFSDQSH